MFVCVAAVFVAKALEVLLAILVEPVGEADVTLLDAFAVAGVAADPLEAEVAVAVQDTAVGRLVTAFALQRSRAYCVAAA